MKLLQYLNNFNQVIDPICQQITICNEEKTDTDFQNVTVECLKKFSSKTQTSDLSVSTSSESNTPRKNSEYSTNEDEDSFEEYTDECCESYTLHGSCMKGTLCEFGHCTQERMASKQSIRMALMNSFPQMLSISMAKRTKSFLA